MPRLVHAPSSALLPLTACSLLSLLLSTPAQAAPPADTTAVPTLTVQAGQSARALEIDGVLQPIRQSVVAAQVSGNILELKVRAGDRVKAGQTLVRIDERSAAAGLAQSDAGVAEAQARLQQAKLNHTRNVDLRKQGYISQAALDQAINDLKAAEAGVAQAQAGRQSAALNRGFTNVTAPFDAVVLSTQADYGDLAAPGRAIATVYAPGMLRAVVQVPSSQAALAKASPRIEIQMPDQRWIAPVKRVDLPTADAVSQTVEWRLDLSPSDAATWLPGQNIRVRFSGADASAAATTKGGAFSVPSAAVLKRGELTAVYVARDDHFALRAVRTGLSQGDRIEVLTGLKPGDRIAADAVRAGLDRARPAR